MKKRLVLFMALGLALAGAVKAQTPTGNVILIGDTTDMVAYSSTPLPYDGNTWSINCSQQMVLGSEMNGAAMITGIDLYASGNELYGAGPCTLYLANTYVPNLGSGMVPYGAAFKQVMVDSLIRHTGWNHYEFDTAFHYYGFGNLVVAWENPGMAGSAAAFYSENTQSGSRYMNYRLIYVGGSGYGNFTPYRNIMRLHTQAVPPAVATCPAPTLRVDSVGSDAVRVNWSPGYQDTSWTVACITDGDTAWRTSPLLWGDTVYTITGLTPSKDYTVRLTAYCTDTFTSVYRHIQTNCLPESLPYSEGLESSWVMPSCWRLFPGSAGSKPGIQSTYRHSGTRSVRMQGGSVVLPPMAAPPDSLELSFWAKNGSTNSSLDMVVGMVVDPLDMATFVPVDTVAVPRNPDWSPFVVRFSNYTGLSGRIAIKTALPNMTYMYIDDIEVNLIMPCNTITNVSIDQIQDTAAVVHWADSDAVYYEVAYGPAGFTVDSTHIVTDIRTDSLYLHGLLPYTLYDVYVRSYCGSFNTNWSPVQSFRTLCSPLATLPYVEDFDSYPSSSSPLAIPCWRGTIDMNSYIVTPSGGETAHSGSRVLRFVYDSYSPSTTKIILPNVDTSIYDMATLQLSFWATNVLNTYNRYDQARIVVGVISDPTEDSTFVPVDTVDIIGEDWQRYIVPLATYSGNGAYICMRECPGYGTHGDSWAMVDDVTIGLADGCPAVGSISITGLTATSVTVRWNEEDTAARYQVSLDTSLSALPTGSAWVSEPQYTFGGLDSGTVYYCWVRVRCPKGDTSDWVGPTALMPGTWNMRPNRTDTLTMCGMTLYDDGGPNGSFIYQNSTLVILPDMAGHLVSLSGRSNCGGSSQVTVYDGVGTSGQVLWTTGWNSRWPITFGPLRSTSGALTLNFNGNSVIGNYEGFEINTVCIPDTCIIHNLELDPAVAETDSTLALTWQCNGAMRYEVEYGPVGFAPGSGTMDSTTSNHYTINGLTSLARREVRVRSICGEGDTGEWAAGIFATALCGDAVFSQNYDSTWAETSHPTLPIGYNGSEYSYVQTIIDSAHLAGLEGGITAMAFRPANNLAADHQGRISVFLANVPDTALTDGPLVPDAGHRFVRVIDSANFNHNVTTEWQLHSFDRAFMWDGHQNLLVAVLRQDGGTGQRTEYACHYRYNDLVNNIYRSYNINYSTPINIDSARTYPSWSAYGAPHVGDMRLYTNTCALPLCPLPTIDSVTGDYESLTVHWSGNGESWQVAADMSWPTTIYPASTPVATTGNQHTFTGLMPSTEYVISLRQNCTADSLGYSNWVYARFTTDSLSCPGPEGLSVDSITFDAATISWQPAGSDSLYQLYVWKDGERAVTRTVYSLPYRLEGLAFGTCYNICVRGYCGSESQIESQWSDTLRFVTDGCAAVDGIEVSSISTSSITIGWNPVANAQDYTVEYGTAGFETGTGTTAVVDSNHFTAHGLMLNTDYDLEVRTRCTDQVVAEPRRITVRTLPENGINSPEGNTLRCTLTPNPAKGSTTLVITDWNPAEGNSVDITISDLTGRQVMSRQVSLPAGATVNLPLRGLTPGAYFVRIQGQRTHAVRKLIIQP